ncbi:hypothetical protein ALC60_00101 [Trachymyrmex zeteki]|nr:hypothetical protein ALC60_00101 [Trachymyrmex zeteki]
MNTRGKKGEGGTSVKLSEEELETLRQSLAKREERLRNQTAAFESERIALEREREALDRERRDAEGGTHGNNDAFDTLRDELVRELATLRRELNSRRDASPGSSIPAGQRLSDLPESPLTNDPAADPACVPKVSLREATDCVPLFDGYNVPLLQFIRACRRARDTVPAHYEKPLTRMLLNKLRGRACYAVEDEPCETVVQLTDLLNGAFGSPKTIDQLRGELSTCYIRSGEHMLDYINRVKELRSSVLDAERRARGTIGSGVATEIDELTARAFCDGLPSLYRIQMSPECFFRPFDAFAAAKVLAKKEEQERRRRDPRSGQAALTEPLTASTSRGSAPRYRPALTTRDRDARSRDPVASHHNFHPTNAPARLRDAPPGIWCRYCKNPGHEIQDCRKRQYNNARQGNASGLSSRPDPPRAGPLPERPVRPIQATPEEEHESESSA